MSDNELPIGRIDAIMSVPRVGWNDPWSVFLAPLMAHRIALFTRPGVFWGHAMQNLFEQRIAAGADLILSLDYDSMFMTADLDRLIERMVERPDIDALAGMQMRRGEDETPLLGVVGQDLVELTAEPIPVSSAHFGFTLLRAECFKALPKPWFHQIPDSKGGWTGDDRADPDCYFWKVWRDNGHSLFVDPSVSVGHLQLMVTDVGPDGRAIHTHVDTWKADRGL